MNVTHDWTRFTKRISINAPIKQVYDAWAKPANLEKWFLKKAEFTHNGKGTRGERDHIQAGDYYAWRWYGHPDEVMERGEIREVNGNSKIQFTFTQSLVTVNFKTEEGETVVEIIQEEIPIFYFIDCCTGWTFYLANLKSVLEGGIDLRNKNEKLKNVINS